MPMDITCADCGRAVSLDRDAPPKTYRCKKCRAARESRRTKWMLFGLVGGGLLLLLAIGGAVAVSVAISGNAPGDPQRAPSAALTPEQMKADQEAKERERAQKEREFVKESVARVVQQIRVNASDTKPGEGAASYTQIGEASIKVSDPQGGVYPFKATMRASIGKTEFGHGMISGTFDPRKKAASGKFFLSANTRSYPRRSTTTVEGEFDAATDPQAAVVLFKNNSRRVH